MSKPLYIFGAGGLGLEVKAMLLQFPEWELKGFYDDGKTRGTPYEGIVCLGSLQDLLQIHQDTFVVLAVGSPSVKEKLAQALKKNPYIHFPSLVHPKATLLETATIHLGAGSIITAGVVLTTRIRIGEHTLINLNATIGHDTVIGDYCSIMPGANLAGEVTLEEKVLIGSGANILNKKCVGNNARIGAGAVVTKDVPANSTAVGVPAKLIK